jgi:hypothetical protein
MTSRWKYSDNNSTHFLCTIALVLITCYTPIATICWIRIRRRRRWWQNENCFLEFKVTRTKETCSITMWVIFQWIAIVCRIIVNLISRGSVLANPFNHFSTKYINTNKWSIMALNFSWNYGNFMPQDKNSPFTCFQHFLTLMCGWCLIRFLSNLAK